MPRAWPVLRKITKKHAKTQPEVRHSEGSAVEQEKPESKHTQIFHVPSMQARPKEPPPRLELPIDIRSSPFSKATYSPPSSPPPSQIPRIPRLRRVQAIEEMSTPAFRIMDLPTELRLNILSYYFGNRTVAVSLQAKSSSQKQFFSLAHKERRLNVIALLQSCRRLSKEACDVLWNSTTFFVKIGDYLPLAKQLKPAIPLQMMRHVVLNIGHSPNAMPWEFRSVLDSFKSLKTADVHFDLTGLRLMLPSMGDWIVEGVVEVLKTERYMKVSCVSHRPNESPDHQMRSLAPYSCVAFEELKEKYHAQDVSLEACGKLMPKLTNGTMTVHDTGLLKPEMSFF